ncbi:hypothetical protein, partial [Pseudomonas viridiflava]|uniref:hypothetical protein n=1 Tax=Pseudomonas viridiflava TaxID=33069 RepID=UPI0019806F70
PTCSNRAGLPPAAERSFRQTSGLINAPLAIVPIHVWLYAIYRRQNPKYNLGKRHINFFSTKRQSE